MIKKYFIKLSPLNSFFFGTFKEFGKKNENYYLRSYIYPQQTAVLGMLRKKLLEDNGLLLSNENRTLEHRKKEEEVIGNLTLNLETSALGKIEQISTIQLYKNETPLFLTYNITSFTEDSFLSNKGDKKLCNYDPKKFQAIFKNCRTGKIEDDIFKNNLEIGINVFKRKNNNEVEKGFFKKERMVFKEKDCYFGFYVSLKEDILLKEGFVQLGDKFSVFYMQVEEKENDEILEHITSEKNSIYLLSDLFLEKEDLDAVIKLSRGALILDNKLKFISRNAKNQVEKADTQNLIARGSIILLDEEKEILKILNQAKYENYRKIGLNHYKEII